MDKVSDCHCFSHVFSLPIRYGTGKKRPACKSHLRIPRIHRDCIPQGEAVDIDLIVVNGGRTGENINVSLLSLPSGWKASIKTYKYGVTGIHLRSDDSKSLLLRLQPEKGVEPGNYIFPIKVETADGKLDFDSQVLVTVTEGKEEKSPEGVNIVPPTPY